MEIIVNSIEINPFGLPVLTDPTIENRVSIGDEVTVKYSCETSGNLKDGSLFQITETEFFFNPALFVQLGQGYFPPHHIPDQAYFVFIKKTDTGKTLTLNLLGNYRTAKSNENATVTIDVLTNTTFDVNLKFRMTSDIHNHLNGRLIHNRFRLSKTSHEASVEMKNTYPSVYNCDKQINALFCAKKGNERAFVQHAQPITARWFNMNLYAEEPVESSDLFLIETKFKRGGVDVESISEFTDTEIVMTLGTNQIAHTVIDCTVLVYEVKKGSNELDYETDLKLAQSVFVEDVASSQEIASFLHTPSTFSHGSSSKIIMTAVVKANMIERDKSYIVIFKPIINDTVRGVQHTTAWRMPALRSCDLPETFEVEMYGEIQDYTSKSEDNVVVVPQERIICDFYFSHQNYDQFAGATDGNYQDFLTDFTRIEVEVFNGATEEVYFNENASRLNDEEISFSESSSMKFEMQEEFLKVSLELRMCWLNEQAHADFTNQDIRVKWTTVFKYLSPNWKLKYNYESLLTVREYDNEIEEASQKIEWIKYRNADTGELISDICNVDRVAVTVKLRDEHIFSNSGFNHMMIAFVEQSPYGAQPLLHGTLKEFEEQTPSLDLTQLQEEPIESASELFGSENGLAIFVIDTSEMQESVQWRISAIAKLADGYDAEPVEPEEDESNHILANETTILTSKDESHLIWS